MMIIHYLYLRLETHENFRIVESERENERRLLYGHEWGAAASDI